MLNRLLIATQHHHAGTFAAFAWPLGNQFLRQIVIVIAQPRAHWFRNIAILAVCPTGMMPVESTGALKIFGDCSGLQATPAPQATSLCSKRICSRAQNFR